MAQHSAVLINETRATALDEAEAYMSHSYCDHQLEAGNTAAAIDFRHRHIQFGRSGFNLLEYGHEVSIGSRGFEEFYMLEMPIEGGVDIAFGLESIRSEPGKALILSPGSRFRSRWREGTRQWMLQIDRKMVDDRFAAVARKRGVGSPVFNPVIDLASQHGRYLATALQAFSDLLSDSGAQVEPSSISAALASVVDELLRNIAYTDGSSLIPERIYASPAHVKQAMDALRERYAEPLLMPVLAAEIGVSERTLYDGFQTYYQRTPHDMLTRFRLEAARRLIRDSGVPVADAARRVGIRHLGRFSATYRETFGVLPSADAKPGH